ncbi:fibroblast growth factor-binding protein 2 [Amia ocellicauda]|uniref:fibroblast growth factor-binding protein 2 n=1 Tax=Amia ocellicauda TaxID=2972642 RepID=UPI003464D9D3
MRLLCVVVFVLCLYGLQGTEGKKESGSSKPPSKKGKSKSIPSSGELITKDNHRCTWETSGEGEVSLFINCNHQDQTYWCRYTGQPDLCTSYNVKSSQYWKQVVSKLKKKKNACEGDKILKTRICKKAPIESHMKLTGKSGADRKVEEKENARAGGKKKETTTQLNDRKREKKPSTSEKDDFGEVNDENLESEMEPVENYCADGWHSVCSFFVKFFDG